MPRTGAPRHPILAVASVVLAAGGATVIVLAATFETPPQPPRHEDDWSGTPSASTPATDGIHEPVLLPSSEPTAIDIPAIGVHSEMQQVGLTAKHTLEVPARGPHHDQAAWYKHSATPGARGPAIIVGHVDSATDGPSVFFHLGNLRPGDEVLVTRGDGTVAIFTVEAVRQHRKDAFPTELVYGDTDHPALRLITCGGPFDRAERSYRDNVIVFATLVGFRQTSSPS